MARRQARRSMIDAIWAPVLVSAGLLALTLGYDLYASERSVLDREDYAQLSVGQSQSSVEAQLPSREANGGDRPADAPADPRGVDDCRFYRSNERTLSPAYRLCFSDGRLAHKDEVVVQP